MFDDSTIFISGGTGSWGNELTRQLLDKYHPKEIRIFSRNEHKQVEMRQRLAKHKNLRFIIGDVRDKTILDLAMKNVDYVFHLAALKHVPVCEENAWEAVLTNIYGTQNIIESAIHNQVKKVVDISTDKAVDPFNHYGVTKACGERLIINANRNYVSKTRFLCIRGGNVMGTNGSVLPLFKQQIQEQNEVTITDPTMTRFLMSTQQAISLIFQAVEHAHGGEVFVMRMPSSTVENIAKVMIQLFGNAKSRMKIVGTRPGEKVHEVLVSKNEATNTRVFSDQYYVIIPQYCGPELAKKYAKYPVVDFTEFSSFSAEKLDLKNFEKILRNERWLWLK